MAKQKVFGANLMDINLINNIPYIAYNPKLLSDSKALYYYYTDILYNKICNMFIWDGIDDFQTCQMLNRCLFMTGQSTLFYDDGKLTAWYSSNFNMPNRYAIYTHHIVANPYLKGDTLRTLEDGKDCITIYNDSNYSGVASIISFYAQVLAENSKSLAIAQHNTRISGFGCGSKRGMREQFRNAIKAMTDTGEPQFLDKDELSDNDFMVNPLAMKSNDIQMLAEINQYWYSQFLLAFGIYSNYAMKKERFNTAEILVNTDLMQINIDDFLQCRLEGVKKFNEWDKHVTDINVHLNPLWQQQFEKSEKKDNNNDNSEIDETDDIESESDNNENDY